MPDETQKSKDAPSDDISFEPETDSDNTKDPAETIRALKEKLKICNKERGEYLDGWQRAKADYINSRKDEEKSRAVFVKFANEGLVAELLPALDSFHTAFGNKEVWEKVDLNWRMGVQHIYIQLRSVLERNGISFIEPKVGEPFDTKKHQSIEVVSVPEKEKDHTVIEVVQKGYALYDKILEPAKVKIGEFKN